MRRPGAVGLAVALLLSAAADRSAAQSPPPAPGAARAAGALPAVTVRAERDEEGQTVDVRERVERDQARDVRELFRRESNADIGGGTRNGQRLYIRGIEGSQINVTIDGARQGANLYNHRGGLGNIDPEIVRRIDIRPGAPAADDGYGALGGSVRLETIDAQDRLAPGQRFGGLFKGSLSSVDDGRRAAAGAFGLLADGVGLLAYLTHTDFGDLRIGGGDRVPYSGGRDRTALLKFSVLNRDGHSLRLGFEDNRADGFNYMQRGDYPYQVQPPFATRPPQDQMLRRQALTARWDWSSGSPWLNLRATAARGEHDFFAPNSQAERFVSRTRNLDLRNELRLDFGGVVNRTTVGVDRFEEDGSSAIANRATTFTGHDNTGLYLQSRFLGPGWRLEAGARRDRWNTDFSARRASDSATSLNLQGAVDLGAVTLFAGVGESARGYSTIPLQFTRNIRPDLTFNGSAAGRLRSETARLAELGARWRTAGLLQPQDRAGAQIKFYDTRIRDAILYRQPGTGGLGGRPVTDFFNFDRAVTFAGWELSLDWTRGPWATSLSLARPRVSNLPTDAQFIARMGAPTGGKLVWDLRWQPDAEWTVGYTLTAVRGLSSVPAVQQVFIPRSGYALHDLQLRWTPAGLRGFSLALAVSNLADRRYSSQVTFTERGFATEEPGRNVRLTASWSF